MASITTASPRARKQTSYACGACGTASLRWVGRCPSCGAWNTLAPLTQRVHQHSGLGVAAAAAFDSAHVVALADVSTDAAHPLPTGVPELDRVLGGGVVGGSVTLLFGPPGIGKSTLLFQVLSSVSEGGLDVVLASAEESLAQVRGRAVRLGPLPRHLLALEGPDIDAIEVAVDRHRPALVVVDSLQSVADPELAQPAGSLAQVRTCVERLMRLAKASGVPVLLVGHVTKDGDLAGPRAVEHLVDTVLSFDGDRHHALRVLTAVKHRFGPAGEVGIFEMRDDGLCAVPDPGPLMLGDRMTGIPGSAVVPVLQGRRPLLVEVQALVGPGAVGGSPGTTVARPQALGLDAARAHLLMTVLACRSGLDMPSSASCFVAAVGGITVSEPASDLAVALALASVVTGRAVPADLVAFGELGLAGEVRIVPGADRRLAEARRAGFRTALVPGSAHYEAPEGMCVHGVRTLADALDRALAPPLDSGADQRSRPGTMLRWPREPAPASL
jgi:DNA repair protein RadA/Sms